MAAKHTNSLTRTICPMERENKSVTGEKKRHEKGLEVGDPKKSHTYLV